MAILKRTIIFEDDLVNGTATLNLSSGEVKSMSATVVKPLENTD